MQHDPVKLLPLVLIDGMRLQRLQIEPYRRDGGLQLMGDGIDESIMLFISVNFAHQEECIQNDAGDNRQHQQNAQKKENTRTPVVQSPTHVQQNDDRDNARAQRNEERDGPLPANADHTISLMGLYATLRSVSSLSSFATRTFFAMPAALSTFNVSHEGSNSYQASPCRAEVGWAW